MRQHGGGRPTGRAPVGHAGGVTGTDRGQVGAAAGPRRRSLSRHRRRRARARPRERPWRSQPTPTRPRPPSRDQGTRSAAETEKIRAALAARRDELQAEYDQTLSRDHRAAARAADRLGRGRPGRHRHQDVRARAGDLPRQQHPRTDHPGRAGPGRLDEGEYGWCERCGNADPGRAARRFPVRDPLRDLQAAGGAALTRRRGTDAPRPPTATGTAERAGRSLGAALRRRRPAVLARPAPLKKALRPAEVLTDPWPGPLSLVVPVYLSLTRNSGAACSSARPHLGLPVGHHRGGDLDQLDGAEATLVARRSPLGLALGGALGNYRPAVPGARAFVGHVVDMVSLFEPYGQALAVFNLADSSPGRRRGASR